ncbi:MAG: THUMP domain-containing protein, partial [Planctomycetota bacterium]
MDDRLQITASCAFGLETILKRELGWLGYAPRVVSPGRIDFEADAEAIAKCNIWLRTASRVGIVLAAGETRDFDALFELVRSVPWADLIP